MAISTNGFIMIADFKMHKIHILNQEGNLVYCHQVNKLGIENPVSLAVDVKGFVWVGCATNSKRTKLAKLDLQRI